MNNRTRHALDVSIAETFRPYSAQARFLAARQRYLLFLGGIGAGKTHAGCLWAICKALAEPGTIGLVTGRTEVKDAINQLLKTIREHLAILQQATGINWIRRYNGHDNVLELLNGSKMVFRGFARNPDSLRGPEYAWAYIDELSAGGETCDPLYVLDLIDGRLRGASGKNKQIAVTMTARGLCSISNRWMQAQERRDPRYYVTKATSYDNPFLPREDLDAWRANMSRRRVEQEIYCKLLRPTAAIFGAEFGERHMVAHDWKTARHWDRLLAIDWGDAKGNVALLIQVNPQTKQWIIADELAPTASDVKSGTLTRQKFRSLLKAFLEKHGPIACAATDRAVPGENAWLRTFLRNHSPEAKVLSMKLRREQSIQNGIEMLRDALDPEHGEPRLLFSRQLNPQVRGDTPGILPSMRNYRWATDRLGRSKGFPEHDDYSHSLDALRYIWVSCRNNRRWHDVLPRMIGLGDVEDRNYLPV